MNKRIPAILLAILVLAGAGYAAYYFYFSTPAGEGAVEAAALEDADIILHLNLRRIEQSGFNRNLRETEEPLPPEIESALEGLGIARTDILEVMVSLKNLAGLNTGTPPEIAGAIRLASPVSLDRLSRNAEDFFGDGAAVERTEIANADALRFPVPDADVTLFITTFDREDGGTTLYFGDESGIRATREKLRSQRERELPASIRAGRDMLMADNHGWLVATLSPDARRELQQAIELSPFPLGPAGQALGSLERAGIAIRMDDSLHFQLALGLGSADQARELEVFVNDALLPIFAHAATAENGPQAPPEFLSRLRAEASGTTLGLTATISQDEAKQVLGAEPPAPADAGSAPEGWPNLRIVSVMPGSRAAAINNDLVEEGEEIEGVLLVRVESNGVILRFNQEYRMVRVGESTSDADD